MLDLYNIFTVHLFSSYTFYTNPFLPPFFLHIVILILISSVHILFSINNNLIDDRVGLPATPHALSLAINENDARVWYGRMVLAPDNAYVPSSLTIADTDTTSTATYGSIRQSLMNNLNSEEKNGVVPGIGCSSPNMKAVITTSSSSRGLQHGGDDTACAEDELFCWFRCMPLVDYNVEVCFSTERTLAVKCMNPRGQVLEGGMAHGDYFLECTDRTNETHPVTDFPMIEQQADDTVCMSDMWDEFIGADDYDHMVELTNVNGTETYLLWTIVEDDATAGGSKKLKARLVFDNVFGYLALGFANKDDTQHNGMNGANIIMAIPGGNYTADKGLDLTVDGSIATYVIHPEESAFRHWQTPIETEDTLSMVRDYEDTGCFTAITFESDHINGIKFNFDGTDEMIWGGNSNDIWMQYHGHEHRSRFTVDWNTGKMAFFGMPMEVITATDAGEVVNDVENGGPMKSGIVGIIALILVSLML